MIDVGDKVYFVRGKFARGPAIVDNIDEITGKRWVNTPDDDGCYLVEESKMFKTREEALASIGKGLKKYKRKTDKEIKKRLIYTRK